MKRLFFSLIVPLVVVILLATRLQAVSPPAGTLQQTETPAATPVADDVAQRISEVKQSWRETRDSFNFDDGQWDTSSGDVDTRFYDTGTYHLRVDKPQTVAWSDGQLDVGDFYLEMTVYPVAGTVNNEFGVLFRKVDNDNFYFFAISSDGYYRLRKIVGNEWQSLVDWTESTAVATGAKAPNVLGVLAEGSRINLLVNDTLLTSVDDADFSQGSLAVAVSTLDEGGVEMAFEDFTLWQPGGEPVESPTTEPTATATPVPVPTLDAQAILDSLDGIKQADPDYSTDFRRPDEDWPTHSDEKSSIAYADRALVIKVDAPQYSTWSAGTATADLGLADFYVEADVTQDMGPAEAGYGMLVRFQDNNNFYFFGISGMGTYSFWKKVDNQWAVISAWQKSDAIRTGTRATNHLGILAEGNRYTLLANDTVLMQAVDDTFTGGNVGLYVETYDKGGVTAMFDNVDIWKTSSQVHAPTATVAPTTTATPIDTAAITQRVDEIKGDEATTTDDFRRDTGVWATGDDADATVEYADRALRILVNQPNWLTWSDDNLTLDDFLLEVDATTNSDQPSGQFGVFFRKVDDKNYYFYGVEPSGYIGLWKKVDDEWQTVIDWVETDAAVIEKGATRRLGVLAEGPQISLLIDGTPLAQAEDSEFSKGAIALAAGTFDASPYEATFDNLSVWEISQP